jgi:hypothetical protein
MTTDVPGSGNEMFESFGIGIMEFQVWLPETSYIKELPGGFTQFGIDK